jgi:DNA-binding NtrC family response regulator
MRKVNVRIVAATNRDLRTLSANKEFCEDLYYRLAMVEIKLPRLNERKEDLPLLEKDMIQRFAGLYNKPIRGLTRRWPATPGRVTCAS